MKSELHSKLQDKASDYMLAKSYWIKAIEMFSPVGIIDVWGLSRSQNYETMAIEVKVSRNDFRSRSQKYKEFSSDHIANRCYILCPKDLILPEEVNPCWGLLWYQEGKKLINKKQAKFRKMTELQKLEILIHFLSSGVNNPPKLTNHKE